MGDDYMCESLMEFNLFDVAKSGSFTVLILALDNLQLYNFPVDSVDEHGNSLLHISVAKGNVEVVNKLISLGASVNILNHKLETPLHLASKLNSTELALKLLNCGAKFDIPDLYHETPIFWAVQFKNLQMVRLLYKSGASLEHKNKAGETLLHVAKTLPTVDYLIKLEMDVNAKNFDGMTPLLKSIYLEDVDILELMLNKGGNINEVDCHQRNLLHYAVMLNKPEMVKLLIEKGCDVNKVNTEGLSPLHCAVDLNRTSMINVLLKNKSDINLCDLDDYTPLHIAAMKADADILKLLIDSGANPELTTFNGDLPLHLAVLAANVAGIIALYDDGLIEKKNKDNMSPLDLAAESTKNIGELIVALGKGKILDSKCITKTN